MKRITTVVALVLSISFATLAFGAEGVKLATVDVNKVFFNSEAGKAVREQLAAKANKFDADKKAKEEELAKLKGELEKQTGGIFSDEAHKAKEQVFFQKKRELDRYLKAAEEEFEATKQELTGRSFEELVKLIQDYGKKNGYSIIFFRNDTMVYVDDKFDLTDEILKVYDNIKKK